MSRAFATLLLGLVCGIMGCSTVNGPVKPGGNMTALSAHRPDAKTGNVNYTDPNAHKPKTPPPPRSVLTLQHVPEQK